MLRASRHLGDIAGFELRHLAALRVDHPVSTPLRASTPGRLADAGCCSDEAGGVEDRPAAGGRSGRMNRGVALLGTARKVGRDIWAMPPRSIPASLRAPAGRVVMTIAGPIGERRDKAGEFALRSVLPSSLRAQGMRPSWNSTVR